MKKKSYMGLDVGSSTCHMVAVDGEGRVVQNLHFLTSEAKLHAALTGVPGEHQVHLEASELAGWIRRILKGQGARVVSAMPRRMRGLPKIPVNAIA